MYTKQEIQLEQYLTQNYLECGDTNLMMPYTKHWISSIKNTK